MAPLMVSTVSGNRKVFEGKITIHVVLSGVIAATGGLMFGYDVGISGKLEIQTGSTSAFRKLQVAIGVILTTELTPTGVLDTKSATKIVVFVCMFISGFAWSWGPLGWLIPSETFPVETRTAGFACAVGSNMLTTFLIAQVFLTMMCKMRAGIFFFFAAWIVVMSLFVLFFLPETKSVPIDEMNEFVWRRHWFWKSFMYEEDQRSTRIGHSPFRPSI